MTPNVMTVSPSTLLTEVAKIFEENNFHHLPVIGENQVPLGIISRHDYHQFQHHFTRHGLEVAEAKNQRLFESLTAEEAMTANPVTLDVEQPIYEVVNIFLANLIHSIIVTEAGLCVGIVTPHDILKEIKKLSVALQ